MILFIPLLPLLPVRKHPEKPRPLDRVLEHLLVLETHTRVVTVPDVPEIIDVLLQCRIIFVIEICDTVSIEYAAFLDVVLGLLLYGHMRGGSGPHSAPDGATRGKEVKSKLKFQVAICNQFVELRV